MRYVDSKIEHTLSQGSTLTMGAFIKVLLNTDDRFNKTGPGIRSAAKIEKSVVRSEEDKQLFIALEDADHELLAQAAESPSAGYPVSPARFCLPFVEAIKDALKELPKSAAKEPEAKAKMEEQPS